MKAKYLSLMVAFAMVALGAATVGATVKSPAGSMMTH